MRARRPWLLALTPVYAAGLLVADALRRTPRKLQAPLISVGSLSAGGAGKTPVVKMLAGLLGRHGVAVDVLSRGYGRESGVVERVDAAGDAPRFGDEPLELARAGLEVYVGAERLAAGRQAERDRAERDRAERGPVGRFAHLLDDGFQHRRLARDLDVVLLTAEDVRDCLLPAGNLREPLRALRRAEVIVLREEEAEGLAAIVGRLSRAEVWVVRRALSLPVTMPAKPVAFCGIARPEGFFSMLAGAGCSVVGTRAFRDHHRYEGEDIARLCAAAEQAGADGFVTTAKDAARLSAAMRETLEEIGPVVLARLEVRLADEEAESRAWKRMRSLFEGGGK